MASKRRNPLARAGNYAQEVDSTGLDPEMKNSLFGAKSLGKMTKVERDYVKDKSGSASSVEAVRRARKANKNKGY